MLHQTLRCLRLFLLGMGFLICMPSMRATPPHFRDHTAGLSGFAEAKDVAEETDKDIFQNVSTKTDKPMEDKKLNHIFGEVAKKGLRGGISGAIAGVIQVLTLMSLRTVINYQMRYGTSFVKAVEILYKDGGVARFYRGVGFALVQAPLSRFVSTAANDSVGLFLASFHATQRWVGLGPSTLIGAIIVGMARMILMPIDTCKTVLQVDSNDGFRTLMKRAREGNVGVFYQGAFANAISAVLGHFPWFYTFNFLSQSKWLDARIPNLLLQNAIAGLTASVVSDTTVNALRVVKTTKQSLGLKRDLSYNEAIRMILAADGWRGLLGRGLRTRILANAIQSVVFTLIWRGLAEHWH